VAKRGPKPAMQLEVSPHTPLLTPAVLAALYDIIEASRAPGRDEGNLEAG
jgi:hypothetical protein